MERILSLFENQIFYIATVEGNQPHVQPFGRLLSYQDGIYLNTGKNKNVYRQMKENPKVELCTFAKGSVVRVTALVEKANDPVICSIMFKHEPTVAEMYKGRESELSVFRLTQIEAVVTAHGKEIQRFTLL